MHGKALTWNDSKTSSNNGYQTSSQIIRRLVDVEPSDLDRRQNPRDYQRRGYQVLRLVSPQVGTSLTGDDDWGSDDSSQHGQRMLKAQQERQE